MHEPIDRGDIIDQSVDSHACLQTRAVAKIYRSRASRSDLRAAMIEKSRRVVEDGIDSLEVVSVKEYR
ncbi:hypothetical protein ACP3TY_05975 [Pseudomonas rustica]|uniref:hypothetical protein n=1 Tax=Pseudomonas TaxID=286 RepID=UPI000879E0B5|nr:hypothetical protein [Pseudomonas sp. Z003-0.4C(8344-21)]SDS62569.1 hypothetical protein SAMN05216496_2019 [Pseudomonas sp. Z003-0.4C(8344-21)]